MDDRKSCLKELHKLTEEECNDGTSSWSAFISFVSREQETMRKGKIEQHISKSVEKWKSENKSVKVITDLSNFLRDSCNGNKDSILNQMNNEWINEKNRLENRLIELTTRYEEKISEKRIIDLISRTNDYIFIIRGFESENTNYKDEKDDHDKLLNYLSELCDQTNTEISQTSFNFDGTKSEYRELSNWNLKTFLYKLLWF